MTLATPDTHEVPHPRGCRLPLVPPGTAAPLAWAASPPTPCCAAITEHRFHGEAPAAGGAS